MWGHGLPADGHFRALIYNPASEHLVSLFDKPTQVPGASTLYLGHLYYRHRFDKEYRPVIGFSDLVKIDEPISPSESPIIYFNVWSPQPGGGFNWHSLSSFNLLTQTLSHISEDKLASAFSGMQRGWISSLIGASPDGNTITGSVAFEKSDCAGGCVVGYYLCEINLLDLEIKKITELADTFA